MARCLMRISRFHFSISLFHPASLLICVHGFAVLASGLCFPLALYAQEQEYEIFANLAAGRAVISVARDGIVVGAVENRGEAGARSPLVIPMSFHRVAILLGATDWYWPNADRNPVLLEREFQKIYNETRTERLSESDEASDIEQLGTRWLEILRPLAGQLHRKVELPEDEPLLEVILAGYVPDYGPEVWSLTYHIVQEPLRGDFWRTRVLRPRYTQLYPPEKGQPRTLMEARYPGEDPEPTLREWMASADPRFERIRAANPAQARASASLQKGESHKALMNDTGEFLRSALGATAPQDAEIQLGVVAEEKGFRWILAPKEPVERVEEGTKREPTAPTLRRKVPPG